MKNKAWRDETEREKSLDFPGTSFDPWENPRIHLCLMAIHACRFTKLWVRITADVIVKNEEMQFSIHSSNLLA